MDEPGGNSSKFKALDHDGYDDGGVGDLTLLIDLNDNALRRKRGVAAYQAAFLADTLPRDTTGNLASLSRRDQKLQLAQLLFQEDGTDQDDINPSEVYINSFDENESEAIKQKKRRRLALAKYALQLSTVLREDACASMTLSEISRRYLNCFGPKAADDALRCVDKAIEVAGDGFYDSDAIVVEVSLVLTGLSG